MSKAYQKVFDLELRNKTGISLTQFKVIFTLYMQSGITQRELADKIGIESPTLVPVIDKMEEEGYVKRILDSGDRRVKRIYTTPKTDSLWESIMECASQIRKVSTKDVLEQDVKSTLVTIKKITENLTVYLDQYNEDDVKKSKN